MSDILTDAIRYWEPRRIPYNSVLALIVCVIFAANWPISLDRTTLDVLERFFVLAVLANVAYCAAYIVDVVAQSSAFQSTWKRHRWIIFLIGVAFASILAKFFATNMLGYGG